MLFSKFSVLALCGFAVAAPTLKPRDAAEVLSDIGLISTDLDNLSTAIAAFTGTQAGALAVSSAAATLETHYDQTVTDADTAFTTLSTDITTAAVALVPKHTSGLNALIAKEPNFEAIGLKSAVLAQVQSLSAASSSFWAALISRANSADVTALTSASSTVASAYAAATSAFT